MTKATEYKEWELFKAFCLYYLDEHCEVPFSSMHDEWMEAVFDNQGTVIAAPRGFAKSHIFCFYLPLYLLLTKTRIKIALIGSSIKNVQTKWVVKIMDELETNALIKQDFGEQKTTVWSRETLKLKNGNMFTPYGVDTKYRGERPNWLIIDDIENDVNVRNPAQRKHVQDMFESSWFNSLTAKGHLVIIGTILHPLGFLPTLINAPYGKRVKWFRKVYKGLLTLDDGTEVSAWPECYPTENLLMRREVSPAKFEQELQNNPLPDEMCPFHLNEIRYYDILPKNLTYCTAVDPAISLDPDADDSVVLTVGTDAEGIMYIADLTAGHYQPDELTEIIYRHADTWGSNPVGIEVAAFQQMLKWYIDTKRKEGGHRPFPIMELKGGNKLDAKHRRIIALQPYIKLGQIRFHSTSDNYEGCTQKPLIDQLACYPGRHDDMVDALAYILEMTRPGTTEDTRKYPVGSEGWIKQKFHKTAQNDRLSKLKRWHS